MKKVADIGAGQTSTLDLYIKGAQTLEINPSDSARYDGVEYQDMENLTYPDASFDIVHCRNALDHTKDAQKAVEEMIRICKPGGTVFIKCWLDQADTGHKHYWNAKDDGSFEGKKNFSLKDYGFKIWYVDHGGERRYNYIQATLEKPK